MTPPPEAADALVVALTEGQGLLVRAAVTTGLCETARQRHQLSPTATAALGRSLTGALLLGSLLKGRQSVLLQWRGDGPLGPVVAEGWADLAVRGYVGRPGADLPARSGKLDVGGGVGPAGTLVVVKDLGLREPYVSTVPLQTGEIGDDLSYYLATSEQIPSAVGLGVYLETDRRVGVAGGILVEALPGSDPELVNRAADNMGRLGSVTEALRQGGLEELLGRALQGIPHRTHPLGQPRYECPCGPGRLEATLAALGPEGLRELLEAEGEVRARCAFCATEWRRPADAESWERDPG
ncbi:MAG: Hsp33 family molecular chaperone HslO [Deferrisomatales bacterium]